MQVTLSDLHVDFKAVVLPNVEAEVTVLAGDIRPCKPAITWIRENLPQRPIVYVLGNHEFYGGAVPKLIDDFRPMTAGTNIHVIEDDCLRVRAAFETIYLDYPFPSAVCVFDLPSLYAGKLHALLCREYMKGRDWYDFVWYTARRTPANYALLSSALDQIGPWRGKNVQSARAWCLERLQERIKTIDWKQAREDVRRFVKSNELPSLDLWNAEFFLAQAAKLA